MFTILLVGKFAQKLASLPDELRQHGFAAIRVSSVEGHTLDTKPDVAVADLTSARSQAEFREGSLNARIKETYPVPVIALIGADLLNAFEPIPNVDDFIVDPYDRLEVIARIRKALCQKEAINSENIIKRGDLLIDTSSYKVFLAGRPVDLTFKEYELLRFLASNPGKVFSRESLLDKLWGYDYYGGDRTVDVHIRRLRSKVEDATHSFIETVRQVGYRFIRTP